jgi:hypothetical protein
MATKGASKTATVGFTTKSVRFPGEMWRLLGAKAKQRGVSRQALLRELIEEFLRMTAKKTAKPRKRARKVA